MHKRANLRLLQEEYRLANDPWFVMKKQDVKRCLVYQKVNRKIFCTICEGGLANESVFAIMLVAQNALKDVRSVCTHATDWSRMTSSTSPHVFLEGNKRDEDFIKKFLLENQCTMFLRKVAQEFPDEILDRYTIEDYEKEKELEQRKRRLFFLEWWIYVCSHKFLLFLIVLTGFQFTVLLTLPTITTF